MLKVPKVAINAEYQRLMWLNFSLGLLIVIMMMYGAFLVVALNEIFTLMHQDDPYDFNNLFILGMCGWLLSIITLVVLMGRSFHQDIASNFYIQLRMSTLSPWQMVWTRLFVAPIMAWISILIGMGMIISAPILCDVYQVSDDCVNYYFGKNPMAFVGLILMLSVMVACGAFINQLQFERSRHEYQGTFLQTSLLMNGLWLLIPIWFDAMGTHSPELFYHQKKQPAYQMTQAVILAGFMLLLATKNMAYQLYLKPFNRFVLLAVLVLPWLFGAVDYVFINDDYSLGGFHRASDDIYWTYTQSQARLFNLVIYLISVPAIACFISVICQDNRLYRFGQVLGYLKTGNYAKALDRLPVWVPCLVMVWGWSLVAYGLIGFDNDGDFVGLATLTTTVLLATGFVYQIARRFLVQVNTITVVLVVLILLRFLLFIGI